MRKFGLIGYPLGHSFSRKYFTEKFKKEGINDSQYDNYPITDINQLKDLISVEPELCGLNVTIPYKSEVLRFLDFIDKEASEIGSVNVIKINRRAGSFILSGYNSDVTGISETLNHYVKNKLNHAMVLGTGGSSRSVCYVLRKMGVRITMVSRESREDVISYRDIKPDLIADIQLIINTTPLGMYPAVEGKPALDYSLLGKNHILFDLVYNPEITSFLASGLKQGCTVITGLKMLHSQAERAWEIWNDKNL
ncbi:MAG: shikimate dehydrogenase [Bacteroidetes bacterium]|nr:shikimate dehydrogenase [Bacteroidota bacterium]